jgi:Uma2 family endonuclease
MSTALRKSKTTIPATEGVVLRGIRYRDYLALRDNPVNFHLRMTYYNGTLEIMSPEATHERPSHRVSIFISVLCEELDIEFEGLGSTTFRRGEKKLKKGHGKEPDECFYFVNAPKIQGKGKIDLDFDPPPDLWLEVDHRSSSKGKLPVYAALGVPEVWRTWAKSGRVWFGRLAKDGKSYDDIDRSLVLPMLTPALVVEALALGHGLLEMTWTKTLRAWVREKFVTPR